MNRLLKPVFRIVIAVGVIFAAFFCRADEASKSRPMENRFLFIINVSSAMKSRTNGIEEAVVRLLETDMHGEFRKGDTIGLWTYNDGLHAEFPMQLWSRERKTEIISDVERYLHHQHYEKRAHIEKVYPAIGQAMQRSERLTLIFIFDPSETLRGTPFDDDISELQKDYLRSFNAAHSPMVTVLTARNGAVFDYTVNFPGTVKIPHTAIPEPPPQTNAPPTNAIAVTLPVVAPPPPPRRHIEIIMSGTNNLSHSTDENVPSPGNAPPASTNLAPTNIIIIATPQPSTNVAVVAAAPALSTNVVVVSAPPAPYTNAVVPPQTVSMTPTNAALPLEVAAIPTNASPVAPKSEPVPQSSVVVSQPPQTPIPQKATAPAEPVVTASPVIAPTPAAMESSSATSNPPPTDTPREEAPKRAQTLPVPRTVPPPVAATGMGQVALFVMAISLLTIAIVLVVLVVRRSRGTGQTSLISQSIDRGR